MALWSVPWGGALGAAISAYGLLQSSFFLLCLGRCSPASICRRRAFTALPPRIGPSDAFRPKAISYVMAGGLLSAVIGPQLGAATVDAMVVPFLGIYLAVVVLNLLGMIKFVFLDIPVPDRNTFAGVVARSRVELMKTPRVVVAVIVAACLMR